MHKNAGRLSAARITCKSVQVEESLAAQVHGGIALVVAKSAFSQDALFGRPSPASLLLLSPSNPLMLGFDGVPCEELGEENPGERTLTGVSAQ